MNVRKILGLVSFAGMAAGAATFARYRRDVEAIRRKVEDGGSIAETALGPVEYAEEGQGEPMLVIHGAGGGYDQGLLVGRDVGQDHRVISPSRFGYLKSPIIGDGTPAAQADVHAALLGHLGIDKAVVVGISAGGPSAIELALRHPKRVSALILLVPRAYDPTEAIGVDDSPSAQAVLKIIEASSDFIFWLAMNVARSSVVRFLGVPPKVEADASPEDRARVDEVMRSILPLSHRVHGIALDSSTEITPWPLETIKVPTLVVSAKDDLFGTLPGAKFTAEHIPGAELKVLESGGHLMVSQGGRVRKWVGEFLASARGRQAPQAPRVRRKAARERVDA